MCNPSFSSSTVVAMETPPRVDSPPPPPPVSSNNAADNEVVPDASNHKDAEQKVEAEQKFDVPREQVTQILQAIASTGKFWHEWDNLKSMLSFQLKQVLSEYPEAKMTSEEQYASLGESYSELVNKLDEELTCFIDGPPFTLQRLCEILLDPKSIYPNLSKLALALEKNLLVTSTLTISTDPHSQATVQETVDQEKATEKQVHQPDSALNGIEPLVDSALNVIEPSVDSALNGIKPTVDSALNGIEPSVAADKDEVMADAEADTGDDMTVDMEASEDAKSSETNPEPNSVTNPETNSNSA